MCVIFDFGGGTHDVTILEILKKRVTVKAINGDPQLGGQDLDIALLKWAIKQFDLQNPDQPLPADDKKIMARLRKACSATKIHLANADSAEIIVDSITSD